MGAPQIILIVLLGISLLINAYQHGKPRTGTHNLFVSILSAGITLWILIAAGFFS